MLFIKRVYEEINNDDDYRVLVDRLWPRGISKEKAKIDYWAKEVAPSTKARKFFNHEADKFEEFEREYLDELNENEKSEQFLDLIRKKQEFKNIALLYAAKNEKLNHALVLKKWIEEHS